MPSTALILSKKNGHILFALLHNFKLHEKPAAVCDWLLRTGNQSGKSWMHSLFLSTNRNCVDCWLFCFQVKVLRFLMVLTYGGKNYVHNLLYPVQKLKTPLYLLNEEFYSSWIRALPFFQDEIQLKHAVARSPYLNKMKRRLRGFNVYFHLFPTVFFPFPIHSF